MSNNNRHHHLNGPAPEVWSLHSGEFEEEHDQARGDDSCDEMEVCSVEEMEDYSEEGDDHLDDDDPKIPQKTEIFEGQVV